jgi:hypothetical protein
VRGGRCAKACRCDPRRVVHRDVIELQRPARKRPGLELGKLLNDDAIDRGNQNRTGIDERRVDPQRGVLILMIEFGCRRSVMVRFEMPVNDFGMPVVRLGDVDVLGRQQRHAEQADYRDERERAPGRHCWNYWRLPTFSTRSSPTRVPWPGLLLRHDEWEGTPRQLPSRGASRPRPRT